MYMKHLRLTLTCLFLCSLSGFAQAYIGPGAGITFIGALIGLVVAIFSAIGFIIFWPIRRAMKKMKGKNADLDAEAEPEAATAAEMTADEEPATAEVEEDSVTELDPQQNQ
jgi:hypothetical protein